MDFFNNIDIDYATYFDLTSPPLRGAAVGGIARWVMAGGPQTFTTDWRFGLSTLTTRTVTSVLLGFPIQYLVDMANLPILRDNKMIVTGVGVYFLIPFFGWLEKGGNAALSKLLNYFSLFGAK